MFTVGHILFNLAVLVQFFDEQEWKWCGMTMFFSNFIDMDNFYSYEKDDGSASALEIHYLHKQTQLNLILFFSCCLLLIAHRLKNFTETPILAFIIGIVFHVVGDWWTWVWDYSVYVALVEIGVFVLLTLYRARSSMYRFYVFLFVGHVCTIFTLGFIVYMILVSDDVDTTKHIWPTIVDNCLRFIMILPWFFLMRVAEIEADAANLSITGRQSKSRRRDPMHRVQSSDNSDSSPTRGRHSRFPEGERTITTVMVGEESDESSSSSPSLEEEESQGSSIVLTKVCESLRESAIQKSMSSIELQSSKSSEKLQQGLKPMGRESISINGKDVEISKLPRKSIKDPTKILMNLNGVPISDQKTMPQSPFFKSSGLTKGECYE